MKACSTGELFVGSAARQAQWLLAGWFGFTALVACGDDKNKTTQLPETGGDAGLPQTGAGSGGLSSYVSCKRESDVRNLGEVNTNYQRVSTAVTPQLSYVLWSARDVNESATLSWTNKKSVTGQTLVFEAGKLSDLRFPKMAWNLSNHILVVGAAEEQDQTPTLQASVFNTDRNKLETGINRTGTTNSKIGIIDLVAISAQEYLIAWWVQGDINVASEVWIAQLSTKTKAFTNVKQLTELPGPVIEGAFSHGKTPTAFVYAVGDGSSSSDLWLRLINNEGVPTGKALAVAKDRIMTGNITAVRLSAGSTLVGWSERLNSGADQVHLLALADGGTADIELIATQGEEQGSLPRLLTFSGVATLVYRGGTSKTKGIRTMLVSAQGMTLLPPSTLHAMDPTHVLDLQAAEVADAARISLAWLQLDAATPYAYAVSAECAE